MSIAQAYRLPHRSSRLDATTEWWTFWAAGVEQSTLARWPFCINGMVKRHDSNDGLLENPEIGQASDVEVTLASLTPDPRNARHHSGRNRALVEQSLCEVGAARSIVVDDDGTILAGNATVAAVAQVGIDRGRIIETDGTELVAVRRSDLSPAYK
jgi:hypothetical protein